MVYLRSKRSINNHNPLFYVIIVQPNPLNAAQMINIDEVIYNIPHNGMAFNSDNKEVHRILDEFTLGTDAAD